MGLGRKKHRGILREQYHSQLSSICARVLNLVDIACAAESVFLIDEYTADATEELLGVIDEAAGVLLQLESLWISGCYRVRRARHEQGRG